MKISALAFTLMLMPPAVVAAQCNAQDRAVSQSQNDARELTFEDIFARRSGDQRTYVLLGGSFIGVRFGDPSAFISNWLVAHPAARITPISRMFTTDTGTLQTSEMVYIWVEDREHSLNVDMVRAGLFPGSAMYDMVDNLKGLNRLLQDPELADTRAQIAKDRAAAPQDRTDRLIANDDYQARIRRIDEAESRARAEKLGIWSDAMKAERQSEGYP